MSARTKFAGPEPTMAEKLRTVPLLVALVPMTGGIVLGSLVPIPLYVWIIAVVICTLTALPTLSANRRSDGHVIFFPAFYTVLAIVFFGAALARAHTPRTTIPRGDRLRMELQITENPTLRARSAGTSGLVTRWQYAESKTNHSADPGSGFSNTNVNPHTRESTHTWQTSRERLLVSFDTIYRLQAGDRVLFRGYVNPVSDTTDSFSRLMTARGYTGRTYISQYSEPKISPRKRKNVSLFFTKLQVSATEKLNRLQVITTNKQTHKTIKANRNISISSDEIAVAAAMTTGDRSAVTPELRKAYSRTGASHLLAVSGLHVGIVFMIINILLYLLPLLPRGHLVKNIVAVAAIWLYAALTGMSPSATRAAFMFTGAQLALASSRTHSAANIMCGTALVMLAVRPGLLFDISFQLSFIAVAAIMAWFRPLYSLVESRFKLLNALWATLIVGFTASLATMPIISHTFGVFSPVGIVLNPVVITTAHLIVVFSLVWIAMPVPALEPVFRWLVGGPAWLQNRVVELTSAVPAAAIEYTLPLGWVFAIYATMIIFTLCLQNRRKPKQT